MAQEETDKKLDGIDRKFTTERLRINRHPYGLTPEGAGTKERRRS